MKKMILMFSHKLTEPQKHEAENQFGIEQFIQLPQNLQEKWSKFPPQADIKKYFTDNFKQWLIENSRENDCILIQGEFGLSFYTVNWSFENKRIPVYAATDRIYEEKENPDGSIVTKHVFRHKNFKRYVRD